jgi:hypothetical protein
MRKKMKGDYKYIPVHGLGCEDDNCSFENPTCQVIDFAVSREQEERIKTLARYAPNIPLCDGTYFQFFTPREVLAMMKKA